MLPIRIIQLHSNYSIAFNNNLIKIKGLAMSSKIQFHWFQQRYKNDFDIGILIYKYGIPIYIFCI